MRDTKGRPNQFASRVAIRNFGRLRRLSTHSLIRKLILAVLSGLVPLAMAAQTTAQSISNQPSALAGSANVAVPTQTNQLNSPPVPAEEIRNQCLAGRRFICGRILKVLPGGLLVESGYTNLIRQPLTRSWLVPQAAKASRDVNQVEGAQPGAPCVGTVFLTDLPKTKGLKPKPYDYVIIEGYPAGEFTYPTVGTLRKTVRRFSAQLARAVELNRRPADSPPPAVPDRK